MRVNIEDEFEMRGRLGKFARAMKCNEREAIGYMYFVWNRTQKAGIINAERSTIVEAIVDRCDEDGDAERVIDSMLRARLASEKPDGTILIHGNRKHVERYQALMAKASIAGKRSAEARAKKAKKSGTSNHMVDRTVNPPVEHMVNPTVNPTVDRTVNHMLNRGPTLPFLDLIHAESSSSVFHSAPQEPKEPTATTPPVFTGDQARSEYFARDLDERVIAIETGEVMSIWRKWQKAQKPETETQLMETLEHLTFYIGLPDSKKSLKTPKSWLVTEAAKGYFAAPKGFVSASARRELETHAAAERAARQRAESAEREEHEALESLFEAHYAEMTDDERRRILATSPQPLESTFAREAFVRGAARAEFVEKRRPPKAVRPPHGVAGKHLRAV